jgi:hypothetical protein
MATLARLKLSLARRLHKNLRVVQGRGAVGEQKVDGLKLRTMERFWEVKWPSFESECC